MRRRPLALVLTAALIGAVFTALPAKAAVEVPAAVQIEDPAGDGNYLNDQGFSGEVVVGGPALPENGDNTTPEDAASVGDILKVWFTNDAQNLTAHIQTEAPGPADFAYIYRVMVDGGAGSSCIWLEGRAPGPGGPAEAAVAVRDTCTEDVSTAGGELKFDEGPDGTGVTTITVPLASNAAFITGAKLATPRAEIRHLVVTPARSATAPLIDNTKAGTEFVIGAGTDAPPVIDEPEEPKPAKNPCKKLKGKKKKKCLKKHADKGCVTFVPGEQGTEAETVVVKDENTEEAPLEVTVTQEPGRGNDQVGGVAYDGTTHQFRNIQIDSAAAEAGLYIRYEFPDQEDHDMYVNYADGTEAAHVGGFNPFPFIPANPVFSTDGTGAGGHSEQGAEQLDGLRTADCAGYTIDFVNFVGEGGDYTVKVWLGEAQNDPAAPADQ